LAFVGSVNTRTNPIDAAARLHAALAFDGDERRDYRTWTEALRRFIDQADTLGALVMVSGVVLKFDAGRRHRALVQSGG